MTTDLTRFQERFAHALLDPTAAPPVLTGQPGFSVYRNTVIKGYIDTLQANFPAVCRLVGEEWFRSCALEYVVAHPPADTAMLRYGAGFADFLTSFPPAKEVPYLPGVAQLDHLWIEAHIAADAGPLDPGVLGRSSPDALGRLSLQVHPAARWIWFAGQPVYTIWHRTRTYQDAQDLHWKGEGALLVRPHGEVCWKPLDASGCAFLDACRAGKTLADAAQCALEVQHDADLSSLLSMLLNAGAFSGVAEPAS
jgi:hypothetical protein